MIKRIVQMTFNPKHIQEFEEIFNQAQQKILEFDGCHTVELFRDSKFPNIMYTISLWESESDLNSYRKSDLFTKTWAKTKKLFCSRPQANSLIQISNQ